MKSRRPLPRQTRGRIGGGGLPTLRDALGPDLVFHLGRLGMTPIYASQDPDLTTWARNFTVLAVGGQADPDGGFGAFRLQDAITGVATVHNYVRASLNGAVGAPATFRFWVADGTDVYVALGNAHSVRVNGFTGQILGIGGAGLVATSVGASGGGYWFEIYTPEVVGAAQVNIYLFEGALSTYVGTGAHQATFYIRPDALTQARASVVSDRSGQGCTHYQATVAGQAAWGPLARQEQDVLRFDGTDDFYLTAAPHVVLDAARTSHAVFAVYNQRRSGATMDILHDTITQRLAFMANRNGQVGVYHAGDVAYRQGGVTPLGWRVWEWYLDAAANRIDVLHTTSAGTVNTITGLTYGTPQTASGASSIGANSTPLYAAQGDLCTIFRISRAPGVHPLGVLTESERQICRHNAFLEAAQCGIVF